MGGIIVIVIIILVVILFLFMRGDPNYILECSEDSDCGECDNCLSGNKICTGGVWGAISGTKCIDCITVGEYCKEGYVCKNQSCESGERCEEDSDCSSNEYCEPFGDYCTEKHNEGEDCNNLRDSCVEGLTCVWDTCLKDNWLEELKTCKVEVDPDSKKFISEDCGEPCENCKDGELSCRVSSNFNGVAKCSECSNFTDCNEGYVCQGYLCVAK